MNKNKEITTKGAWSIIILIYLIIAAGIAFIIFKELNTYISLLVFLLISIFGIIGTVPNVSEVEIKEKKGLTFFIVITNEIVFYLIAFVYSVFIVSLITKNSFLFVLLVLIFTIIFIFVEINIFYKLKPAYKILRNYVNDNINFVNLFTFLSIIGTLLSSDFSLSSMLINENSADIEVLKDIFSISSTAFLGYWLINNIVNKVKS